MLVKNFDRIYKLIYFIKAFLLLSLILFIGIDTNAQTPSPTPAPEKIQGVPQIAPDYKKEDAKLPELGRVGVDMMEQKTLSLREALELALTNNKDIEVARDNVKIAEFDFKGARGVYEPRLSFSSFYERAETPTGSLISGPGGATTQSTFNGGFRFEGLSPKYGGSYRVDFNNSRVNTNNAFATLNPQFPTSLSFSYTQPLIRGRKIDQQRRAIEISKKNLSLTDVQFRQRTIDVITAVQRAYWDLVFTLKNLQVQRDAVRDAKSQLEHNKRLVEEGILAPIDIVSVEAQVAAFEQNVYVALDDVNRAENNLKNLISENRNAELWNKSIVPTDPVELNAPVVSLQDAMTAALDNRPELQQSDVAKEINEIDQNFYREQTKPQVDLVGTYTTAGLAGSTNANSSNLLTGSTTLLTNRVNLLSSRIDPTLPSLPLPQTTPLPDNLVGGYGQSVGNLLLNRYPTVRVGVQINLPLKNQTAEAQLGRSLVEGKRIQTQREQLEQIIQVDVRNALQAVRSSEARLRAAAAQREATEKQYASEQRKFDAGQSTLFLVLERQTALTNARGAELRAQTDLNKAIAELQRATGNSLKANNVEARLR
jgi:HAE1 family hydrophobic/amphiphilic exporter-1